MLPYPFCGTRKDLIDITRQIHRITRQVVQYLNWVSSIPYLSEKVDVVGGFVG